MKEAMEFDRSTATPLTARLQWQALLQHAAIDYIYVETGSAGEAIAEYLTQFGYIAVPLGLGRVLTAAEVAAKFTNVFVSARVGREECELCNGTS